MAADERISGETSGNEQTIINLETELESLAEAIHTDTVDLADTIAAITEADEEIETLRADKMKAVLASRFIANNQLQYTNSEQRNVAVSDLLAADATHEQFKTARIALVSTQAGQKANIEKNRNLHKAKLLVLQYYVNAP